MSATEEAGGRRVIPGWGHQPGLHCGSTALSDLMHFSGSPCSEALCFGLGAGLGFYYVELEGMSPSRMFHVRSSGLEPDFFDSLGIPFAWQKTEDPEEAERSARAAVDRGFPVLLRTDIYHLDYYRSSTHFNGHVVVLWGYDDRLGQAFLSDTGWPGLQSVPFDSLRCARASQAPPVPLRHDHFVAADLAPCREQATAIREALGRNARHMLSPTGGNPSFAYGLEGLRILRARLPTWAEAPDWKWCARFTYQVIEKRGTGGGAFRLLYQRFLEEAEAAIPSMRPHGLSARMGQIASLWSELAGVLKEVSEAASPAGLRRAGEVVEAVAAREEDFYRAVLSLG